jgi:hypothetical protein
MVTSRRPAASVSSTRPTIKRAGAAASYAGPSDRARGQSLLPTAPRTPSNPKNSGQDWRGESSPKYSNFSSASGVTGSPSRTITCPACTVTMTGATAAAAASRAARVACSSTRTFGRMKDRTRTTTSRRSTGFNSIDTRSGSCSLIRATLSRANLTGEHAGQEPPGFPLDPAPARIREAHQQLGIFRTQPFESGLGLLGGRSQIGSPLGSNRVQLSEQPVERFELGCLHRRIADENDIARIVVGFLPCLLGQQARLERCCVRSFDRPVGDLPRLECDPARFPGTVDQHSEGGPQDEKDPEPDEDMARSMTQRDEHQERVGPEAIDTRGAFV